MSDVFRAADAKQVCDVVSWAAAEEQPLEIIAGGSKRGIGRSTQVGRVLDVSALAGIVDYEAAELVLTAAAATPLEQIERALRQQNQMLAFEPPDWRALLGTQARTPTIGGAVCCNLAGPRRMMAGAARDHLLGFQAVNGRGELFKAGGKVVKNVTGYDLCKLFAGSYGTLGVLTELSVKVLPRPEAVRTIMVFGLADAAAIAALSEALNSPHEVSAAAHLPHRAASRSAVDGVSGAGRSVTALRIEGPEPSTSYRGREIVEILTRHGVTGELGNEASEAFWLEIRDVSPFADEPERFVWRISVAPSAGAAVAADIGRQTDAEHFFDWAGGLLWLAIPAHVPDAGAAFVRMAIVTHGGGHATLLRASESIRASVPVFEPLPAPLAALSARVKEGFDPRRVLNPGRMYAGV